MSTDSIDRGGPPSSNGADPETTDGEAGSEGPASAVEVTHSPARISSIVAVVAALLAALASGLTSSFVALVVGLFGVAGVAGGLFGIESERLVAAGTGIVFLGVIAAGVFGSTPAVLLFSALATIVAFDAGQNAFSVGTQLSDATDTTRGELVHTAATFGVGAFAAIVAYGIYLVAAGGQTVTALAAVVLAGIVLVWAVRT